MKKAPILYSGAYEDREAIEAKLKEAAKHIQSQEFHSWSAKYSQLQAAKTRYSWWVKNQKTLQDEKNWVILFKKVPKGHQKTFAKLQKAWQRHGAYAHYASEALFITAYTLLPAFEIYLEYLTIEFKAKKKLLDAKVREDCKAYIQKSQKWLRETKQGLAAAMAQRLQVASHQKDLSYDDVTHWTVKQLQALKALPDNLQLPKASHGLHPKYFQAFHDYIATVSPYKEGLRLRHNAHWLKRDRNYRTVLRRGKLLILPKALEPLRPKNRFERWWQKVTKAPRIDTYLQENRHLIAQCRLLETEKECIAIHAKPAVITLQLTKLETLQEKLLEKLKALEAQKPKGLMRFFKRSHYNRIQGLEKYWKSQCQVIADKILNALQKQMAHWEGEGFIKDKVTFTKTQATLIDTLNSLLQVLEKQKYLSKTQQEALQKLTQRFTQVSKLTPSESKRMKAYLQELAQGILKGHGHLKPLYDYVENLKNKNPKAWHTFQSQCQKALKKMLSLFKDTLETLAKTLTPLTDKSLKELARVFICVMQLGTPEDKKQLKTVSHELYSHYLKNLTEKKPCAPWLLQVENILLSQAISLGDEGQKENLQKLHALREKKDEGLEDKAKHLLKDDTKKILIRECKERIEALQKALSHHIEKTIPHRGTQKHLLKLITQAKEKGVKSLTDLTLAPFEKTLLGLEDRPQEPLRLCNKLLSLQNQQQKLQDLEVKTLQALKENLRKMKTTFDLISHPATLLSPPLKSAKNPMDNPSSSPTLTTGAPTP